MQTLNRMNPAVRKPGSMPWRVLAAALFVACGATATAQIVGQSPLSSGGNVPGNLLLVPSVEWPTVDSVANIETDYVQANEYVGYFDPDKCYKYSYSANEPDRYFYPTGAASSHGCAYTNKEWSGNFLNWSATQTIDPFRKALTGGYRTTDTSTVTIVEKARSDGNTGTSIFPDRRIPTSGDNNNIVRASTAADWDHFQMRIRTLGNKMRFTQDGDVNTGGTITIYDPANTLDNTTATKAKVYEVSMRVKVCVNGMLEDNCIVYGSYAKPEGLIQKYANRIRYSAFGYLNDHVTSRDGGVLRAKQKFVGPTRPDPATGVFSTNPAAEWSATDGTQVINPDTTDASTTTTAVNGLTISNSGVINYINKFGQMTTKDHKSFDPVSELYYTALRYLRNKGNVADYTNLGLGTAQNRYELADGFPVITEWDDPYQYWCQSSAILGIGDVNTHRDKNLYGTTRTVEEPSMPTEVSSDTTVDVNVWTQKVATLEGITINTPFSGRENSAYMAGLAYWAHTQDLRPEAALPNKQTVSTYWVDVREARTLMGRTQNQYWLTAKYGGFTVPKTYDSLTNTTPLDPDWWFTSGEYLTTGTTYPRTDNFYVASDANNMVDSLTRAFARIGTDRVGSGASLAANSTRLDTQTRTFQAQFNNLMYGQINSFDVDEATGALSTDPVWTAGTPVSDAPMAPVTPGVELTRANFASRNIWVNGTTYSTFTDTNLTATQKTQIKYVGLPSSGVRATTTAQVVDWFRGSVVKEESETNGTLRTRIAPTTGWSPILGDVVNSTPVFVGAPSATLYSNSTFNGASSYATFAAAQASRLGVLYVGGNDGMLHSFNATNGKEVYAFIPNASFVNGLGEFANPEYQHRYFVDGDMAIADVYNTATSSWKTVLVGTMGRGGPGIFALDITDPQNPAFLWEKGTTQIPRLGKNIGRPVIAQVASGDWRVIFGNGPDGSGGYAELVMVSLVPVGATAAGNVTIKDAQTGLNNGLSATLVRDTNSDGFADTAYAGDLKGNVWKFAGIGTGSITATSIFIAKTAGGVVQPITAAPNVARDPATSISWVFFGTGQYLNNSDLTNTQAQTWYGIQDTGTVPTRATLVQRTFTSVAGGIGDFTAARTLTQAVAGDMAGRLGWYIDLPASGERIVVPNRFQGAALIGTSRIPTLVDVCQPTGRGFVMAISPFTGGRLQTTFFDTNHDGLFNSSDTNGGEVITGIGFDSSANNPIFIENVMQVGLDDGTTRTIRTQGTNVDASRMSWREILN